MRKGTRASAETCRRISESRKGQRISEETKQKLSIAGMGKHSKRLCPKGHDTSKVGRNLSNNCRLCKCSEEAIKRSLPFELTDDQFAEVVNKDCIYKCSACSKTGIDRVDSSKGYVVGNVQPMCGHHNKMKLDHSVAKFKILCAGVV